MKWYRNPVSMLFGNTITLCILLSYASFLNHGMAATLVAIFASSIIWSWITKDKQLIQGMLPVLLSTTFLQFAYFISGKDLFPIEAIIAQFSINIVIYSLVSFIGSWIGKTIGNKIRGKKEEEEKRQEKMRSQFSENLRRLTSIVLILYVQAFILVPFASKVFASEKQTSDEFIQNYDPEKQYKVSSQWVYEPPKERMPKEGTVNIGSTTTYEYLTEEQIKEIETKCQIPGCNSKEELEKVNNEQKKYLEEEQRVNKLEFTNPEQAKLEKLKNKQLTIDQILKLQKDGKINSKEAFALVANGIKTGKISTWDAFWKGRKAIQEFVKNNPEAQKVIADFMQHPTDWGAQYRLLSLADKYIGGPFHGGKEFADVAVVDPWNAFKKEFREHPIETLQNLKTGALIVVISIAVPPVGVALVTGGILVTSTSMGIDYYQGGWDKAKHHIYSQKTIDMDKSGDWWGARSRQVAEVGGFILSNIPDSPTRTLETVAVIGGILKVKKEITAAQDARAAFSILKQTGRVSKETFKVGQELFKVGLSKGANETKLFADYLFNNNNLAYLGTISKEVNDAEKIGGLEAKQAALKKEFDGLMRMIGGNNNQTRLQMGYLDISPPKWTTREQTMHSLGGEIVNGSLKGVHHVPSNPHIISITQLPTHKTNSLGFYEALVEVELNGTKYTKSSTMWPDDWPQSKIDASAKWAFNNKKLLGGNKYMGTTPQGVHVIFYKDPAGAFNYFPQL